MTKPQSRFDELCVGLIFLFSAILILFVGIRTAGVIIDFARAQQIQIINNFIEGLKTDPTAKIQNGQIQDISGKYIEAYLRAIADFEFVPRNDIPVLVQVINAVPEETEIVSFSYTGRDLTITTTQPNAQSVLDMSQKFEKSELFSNVVYSYYINDNGECVAEITLLSYHYEENDIRAILTNNSSD